MECTLRISTAAALTAATLAGGLLTAGPVQAAPHQGGLHLGVIQYDSPGSDRGSNTSLNAEWVDLHNSTRSAIQLKGYKLKDNTGYTYTFGSLKIGAGKSVRVHTGKATNSATHVYWGRGWYVWNNTSDKARLLKPNGSVLDSCAWTTRDRGTKNCH